MKLGVHLVNFTLPDGPPSIGPTMATVARAAEDAGVVNLSLMDHYLQLEMMGAADLPMLEGYTSLGFLAGLTSTVELQLLVTGVTYRHPGLLAKIVSTSTCSRAAARCSASAPPGTSGSTGRSAFPIPRWPSGSSAWRRRCRSSARC